MGYSIDIHKQKDGLLYVFGLDGTGRKYTVVYNDGDKVKQLKCILLPNNEWGAEAFQSAIEARDESKRYLIENTGPNVENGCLTYNQFIPRKYWGELEIDTEIVRNTDIELEQEPTKDD
jgi:hypothetical protein